MLRLLVVSQFERGESRRIPPRRPALFGVRFVNRHAFRKNDPRLCTTCPIMRSRLDLRGVIQCPAAHDSLFAGSDNVQL
jgi:hypothetical protein